MKDIDLSTQYDGFSDTFAAAIDNDTNPSRRAFYAALPTNLADKELLDLACGDGSDLPEYVQRGAHCSGIDASERLVMSARVAHPNTEILLGNMRQLPYPNQRFDIVVSKYALGTVSDLNEVFSEVARVLRPGGIFAYLTTHPFRLFLEQRGSSKDYFTRKDVPLHVFGGQFTIVEPSHTFNDFFSPSFLKRFSVGTYSEHYDPQSADFPGRNTYPDFFIVVATRK